jgi:hypothetical protein
MAGPDDVRDAAVGNDEGFVEYKALDLTALTSTLLRRRTLFLGGRGRPKIWVIRRA